MKSKNTPRKKTHHTLAEKLKIYEEFTQKAERLKDKDMVVAFSKALPALPLIECYFCKQLTSRTPNHIFHHHRSYVGPKSTASSNSTTTTTKAVYACIDCKLSSGRRHYYTKKKYGLAS